MSRLQAQGKSCIGSPRFRNSLFNAMASSSVSQAKNLGELLDILTKVIPNVISADSSSLEDSRIEAVRACEKMCALLYDPFEWLFLESAAYIVPAAISVVLELKVPHHVSSDPECPTSVEQLAVATGGSAELLGKRIKRPTSNESLGMLKTNSRTHASHIDKTTNI